MSRTFHILAIVWAVGTAIVLVDYIVAPRRKKVKPSVFWVIAPEVFFAPVVAALVVLAWTCDALDWLMKRNEDRKGR